MSEDAGRVLSSEKFSPCPERSPCVGVHLWSLVLSDSSSSTGAGCHGTDVAKASSVRLSPDRSAPRSSGESAPGRGQSTTGSGTPFWPGRAWFSDLIALLGSSPWDLLSQAGGTIFHPHPELWKLWVWPLREHSS